MFRNENIYCFKKLQSKIFSRKQIVKDVFYNLHVSNIHIGIKNIDRKIIALKFYAEV